jgi:acyl dehydratase
VRKPDLSLGQEAKRTRTVTAGDIIDYRSLSGDRNVDWGGVPGPLLAGMISDLLGTELPGEGTMWMKQRMSFPAPAPVGAEVVATVRITRFRPEKDLVNLAASCCVAGETVLDGETLVMVPDLAGRMAS